VARAEREILMNGEREKILGRIREALAVPAPRHHETQKPAAASAATASFREWLPAVGATVEERVALFGRQSELLRTDFRRCTDLGDAAAQIAGLAQEHGWRKVALHAGELCKGAAEKLSPEVELLHVAEGYDKRALETCDAGLSECETLIAQTGSACVTSRSSGGRALSVLPPHHVVVARESQLVPDLSAAYEHLALRYGTEYPSFISFISGPSRTGDIERILVLGAHGPRKLTILLIP
jgi:L-lactate dehydrogenase complex protein LldG